MGLEECYAAMGGDLEGVRSRLITDERIGKFVPTFLGDESMQLFRDSFAAGDYDTAYRAVHTLKGISRDLGFTPLYEVSYQMQEKLRVPEDGGERDVADASALVPKLEEAYTQVVDAIGLL